MMNVINDLVTRWPALQSIYMYAVAIPLLVVGFVLLRFVLGRASKRRDESFASGADMMMSFEQMWKRGLITEEEYKAARRKAAEKQLSAINSDAQARETQKFLKAVELNPELARELIKPVAPAPPRPAPQPQPAAPRPPAEPIFRIISEEVVNEHPTAPLPADFGRPSPKARQVVEEQDFIPGDPLSDPRMNQDYVIPASDPPPAAPPAPQEPPTEAGGEIEALYKKGLISREDYERLTKLARGTG